MSYIVGSDEYFIHNGSTAQSFVTAMYHDLFGRVPDAGGQAYWVDLATNGKVAGSGGTQPISRDEVVRRFVLTQEGSNKLLDGNYLTLTGDVPPAPPGTPQGGSFALANATGNGLGFLYFRGTISPALASEFLSQFRSSNSNANYKNDENAIQTLLNSDEYFFGSSG